MARDRQRAKQRRAKRQPGAGGPAAGSASTNARDIGLDQADADDAGLGNTVPPEPTKHGMPYVEEAHMAEAGPVKVQHVLIGWKDTPAAKSGRGDPKAMNRNKEDADKLAKDVLGKARQGGDMAKLMKEFSEDPGSKDSARAYDVSADAPILPQAVAA